MTLSSSTRKTAALIGLASCLLAPRGAAQSLTITPRNATVTAGTATFTVTQGGTFTLVADLQNISGSTLSLNGDDLNFVAVTPGPTEIGSPTSVGTVALDDSVFFNTLPRQVTTNQPLLGASLFTLTAGTGAMPGTYNGYFTVQGGPAPSTTTANDLQTVPFTVRITPTPEPSALAVFVLGAAGLAGRLVLRRKMAA